MAPEQPAKAAASPPASHPTETQPEPRRDVESRRDVEHVRAAPKEAPRATPKDAPRDVAKEAPKEASKEAPKEAPREATKERTSEPTSEPNREPSSWSRLHAAVAVNGSSRASLTERAASMRESAASVWRSTAGVRTAIRGSAVKVGAQMSDRIQKASDAFDAPADIELDGLYSTADLPALDLADPIASIVARLDRESDLLRGIALRALSRAGWADRMAQGAGLFMGLGAAALAVIAALGALFGAEGAAARVLLICAALGALVVGAAVVTWISGSVRRAQREIAREAMERADLIELRIHRVGVVTAILQTSEPSGRAAIECLERLERDVSAPPR